MNDFNNGMPIGIDPAARAMAAKCGGGVAPQIIVTAPTGSTVTVTNGIVTLTAAEESGTWLFRLPDCGTWTVNASKDGFYTSKEIAVSEVKQYSVRLSYWMATLHIYAPVGAIITVTGNEEEQTIISTGEDDITVYAAGTYTVSRDKNGKTAERSITITEEGATTDLVLSMRYGYRKKKSEGNPATRVEYILDAVGMTPAAMNFSTGKFNYGSWGGEWFVTKNKPLMLKSDRTVDYYLDPNDYTKKENGEPSDVSNMEYDGNAMAQFPLCYFYRYQDDLYEYEIVCERPWDENYKAYAHTRADGTIADYFYWSLFGGSGSSSKIRSILGQQLSRSLTAQQEIDGAKANGAGWYTHTWSQREFIRTLLVLMGKSTDTQSVFGTGNAHSGGEADMLLTGTVHDKGQFWGSNANNRQVKVFHIEKFWGDQWDRTAGLINNSGSICVKMTPEGQGYRVTDVTGYTDTGITVGGSSGGYISATQCGDFGCIPSTISGSGSTFECDGSWFNNGQLDYLLAGGSVNIDPAFCGAFSFYVYYAPSRTLWIIGCGLSCEQPVAA